MGSKSKNSKQKRLSNTQVQSINAANDFRYMKVTEQIGQTLSVLTAKVEVLERLAKEKLGLTDLDLNERFFDRLDDMNGIKKSEDAIQSGDRTRIQFVQGEAGDDISGLTPETTMLIVGQKQVHENLDNALLGKKKGDTFEAVLPPLKEGSKDVIVKGEIRAVYAMNRKPVNEQEASTKTETK